MPGVMMSNRELRRVPMDYKHPTIGEQAERFGGNTWNSLRGDVSHELHPLFLQPYDDALREWLERREAWQRGERPGYFTEREGDPWTFEEYDSKPPDPAYYLRHPLPPEGPECPYGIQLWQTVSEGSPISPVFEDSAEGRRQLAEYMVEHDTKSILSHLTAEEWLLLIGGEVLGTDIHTGELV